MKAIEVKRTGVAGGFPALAKLRQVAKHAGVSAATVSRAFNHPELVAATTLGRVREAVAALEFVPNPTARALSKGRSRLIGALIPTIGYSIFADYMEAVQLECGGSDYTLVLGVYGFNAHEELRQARRLVEAGVQGFLLVGFGHDALLFDAMSSRKLPYVCTSVYDPRSPHPNVGYDNTGAGKHIATHLLKLGHRRIGVITGDTRQNDRMAQRLVGIRAALRRAGQPLPADGLIECDYTPAEGRAAFARMYESYRPSAVICGNDVIGIGVLQQARGLGLAVPAQLSVVGFDGLDWASEFTPAISTMLVPMEDMGRRAAQALIARVEGRPAPHAFEIALTLKERETTAMAQGPNSDSSSKAIPGNRASALARRRG